MHTSIFTWAKRMRHAVLGLGLALVSASVLADTIHARATSNGLSLQLTSLTPGGIPSFEEVERSYFLDGSVNSRTLQTYGFTQYLPGNPFPIEQEISVEDGMLHGVVTDSSSLGAVEVMLSPVAPHRDRPWDAAQKSSSHLSGWLSPATTLTATTYVQGLLWLDDAARNMLYKAGATWSLTSYSNAGKQTDSFAISNAGRQFPVSDDDYLQLVITNTTAEPMWFVLESVGMATARWESAVPIPEPSSWLMLVLGLLMIGFRTRPIARAARRARAYLGVPCRAAVRGAATIMAGALLLPVAAKAQALDITATIGPVVELQSGAGAPLDFTWDDIRMLAQVRESGYPHVGLHREALGTIPSPFEVAPRSGASWVDFGVPGPHGAGTLHAHLEQHLLNPTPGSFMVAEIQGTISSIVVPAHSKGRIAIVIEVTPALPNELSYRVQGTLGSAFGGDFWTTSANGPNTGTIFSVPSFDNRDGTEPRAFGPVYFSGTIRAEIPMTPIPEPSRAWMMGAGLVLLIGIAGRNSRKRASSR